MIKKENLTEEAYKNAIKVLEHCVRPVGFFASGLPGGYEAVWARDSMITSLGASLAGERFKKVFRKSLELLGKNQSRHGQIPNAVGSYNIERRSDVTYNSIDSSLWFLIGHHVYKKAYGDASLFKKQKDNINAVLTWLEHQDPNEDGLLVQQPTMDWFDAFPHKYGRTINTQALYYAVLKMHNRKELARRIKRVVNGDIEKYLSLYDRKRGYYLPWAWKTHGPDIREEEYWFDTLGNLLAIVTGLATPKIAKGILRFIEKNKINRPYPCKTIHPPIKKGDKEWHDYFAESESVRPYHYANAGIWPFIGGFYVAALVKAGQLNKAKRELTLLAKANRLIKPDIKLKKWLASRSLGEGWGFQEWLHGKTGKPEGGSSPYQGWSAGAYVFAYESVKQKRTPYFS